MRIAFHFDPPLAAIPRLLEDEGVSAFQTTLRNPQRFGKDGVPDEADRAAFRAAAQERGLWGVAHATLLTNLASPDGRIRNASLSALRGDLALAAALGLAGVCFHLGYQKGHPDRDAAHAAAVRKLSQAIEKLPAGGRALLENTCEGSELAQTVEEMGRVFRDVGAPPEQLGLLLDTCHLHAAGFDLASPDAGERLAAALDGEGLLQRLAAFHLNDCGGPAGCGRDRHVAPGEGSIGEGLLSIAAHPAFRALPAVLELSIESARRGARFLAGA